MKAYKSFQGAVSEIITPFTNQKLDEDLLEREVDFQIQSGIAGLFANGLASEGLLMSLEERIRVAKIVVDKVSGVIPVMANITAQNTQEGVWLAEQYANLGADALCITQPMVYGFTQPALYEHFSAILCATDLPVCIYNAPQSGNILAPQTVAKLFLEHGNAHYYKESTIDIMRMVDIHLVGTWRTCSVAAKLMLEQGGGRIINVASTAGLKASPNLGHYAMAKAGIISLTKTLAKEVAKKGITVNVLCATMIESPMTRQVPFLDHIYQTSGVRYASFEEMNEQMKAKRPMGIAFLPIEPASELCYWAATSEAARYITGAVLPLDAGTML